VQQAGTGPVEVVTSYLRRVLAPNPGPMTLEGTNTWVVGDPALGAVVVVDPGPLLESHLRAVLDACSGRLSTIVLTHRHDDHAGGAAELARRAGCGVRAAHPDLRQGPAGLADGAVVLAAGATLTVHATPGHTGDSCSLLLHGDDGVARLLTGDTVLGRGTSVIAAPDGDLGAYLGSLAALRRLVETEKAVELLPGHGPRVGAPTAWLAHYQRHREERLHQVRAALAAGDRTVAEVLRRVYAGLDPSLRAAATQSVQAQLDYLEWLEWLEQQG